MRKSTKGLFGIVAGALAGAAIYKFFQNKKSECAEGDVISDETDVTDAAEDEAECSGEGECTSEEETKEECGCESVSEEQAEASEEESTDETAE